jgi:hypothetical protein
MSRKRKRAPATAPALDHSTKQDVTLNEQRSQPRKSGYANAVASERHIALARMTEKISSAGNLYFVGSLGGANVVMLRADPLPGGEAEWTLFLWKPRPKRGGPDISEAGPATVTAGVQHDRSPRTAINSNG